MMKAHSPCYMVRWVSKLGFLISLFAVFLGCRDAHELTSELRTTSNVDRFVVKSIEKLGVQIELEISPKQPRLSDLVDLTIKIVHPSSIKIEPPVFGQSVGDFAVRDYSERSSVDSNSSETKQSDSTETRKQETLTQIIRYKLEPMFSGKHLIRSIPIVFITESADGTENRDIVQSDPIEIDVVSEFGEVSSDLSQVDPMTDPIAPKGGYFWIGLCIVTLCALVLITVFLLIRKQRSKLIVAPVLSPEEIAKLALTQLIAEELPSKGMVKEFYLRLTGIVRVFIEGRTGLRAPEQTTEEFLREMRASSRFDGPQAYRLQEFLTAADLVKYAGQTPDESSILQSVERAHEFITIRFDKSEDGSSSPITTERVND